MIIPLVIHSFYNHYNSKENEEALTLLHCLRRKPSSFQLLTEYDIAKEVEEATSLTKGDLTHVFSIFFSELRKSLVRGDRVKITDIGTFYMNIASDSVEDEEKLSVRSIKRVNIRFLPDKALKLVNNATAPTRSDNNVTFAIVDAKDAAAAPVTPGGTDPGDGEEEYIDPNA